MIVAWKLKADGTIDVILGVYETVAEFEKDALPVMAEGTKVMAGTVVPFAKVAYIPPKLAITE